jgi:CspA family cold shock protein
VNRQIHVGPYTDVMTTRGVVRFWNENEGWGVIDSEQTPSGCWAHFSVIDFDGFRALTAGQVVNFNWVQGDQDGYSYSASEIRLIAST